MKVVMDTNVLVAAFATQGLCHAVFELCLDQQEIVISREILQELGAAIEKKLKAPHTVAKRTIEYIKEHSSIHSIKGPFDRVSRDSSDDHILALAQDAAVDYIITGDEDLLVLSPYKGIPILQPRQFWEIMKNRESRPEKV
jgi:putative PIN family toxin of toxin-antitoxin system